MICLDSSLTFSYINNTMKELGYDIETIPQQAPLSKAQGEWLDKKIERSLVKNPNQPKEELRRKLMATTPFLGEIVCISVGTIDTKDNVKTKSFVGKEENILRNFWDLLGGKNKFLFISYNGLDFDVPYILARSMRYNITPTNKSFTMLRRYSKEPHYDVMRWISNWNFRSPTLDVACDLVGIPSPKDGAIKAENVEQAYKDGKINEIKTYCEKDVKTTLKLYRVVQQYY